MGQKQSPIALRQGINRSSSSVWYARPGKYKQYIQDDFKVRNYLQKNYHSAGEDEQAFAGVLRGRQAQRNAC